MRWRPGPVAPVDDWTADEAERALPTVDPSAPPFPVSLVPNAASSLLTTARDYGAFLSHLVASETVSRMIVPQVTINEHLRWGLGVGLQDTDGRTLFWHWGDNPGFKHFLLGNAARREAIAIFTNGNNGMRVYERVVRGMTGADQPAFLWL